MKNLKEDKWEFFILDVIAEVVLLFFDDYILIKFLVCL